MTGDSSSGQTWVIDSRSAPSVGFARLAASATSVERQLWMGVAVTLVGDVALTLLGIGLGLTEANPIVATLMNGIGTFTALAATKAAAICIGLAGWALLSKPNRGLVPLALVVPWALATTINVVMIVTHLVG